MDFGMHSLDLKSWNHLPWSDLGKANSFQFFERRSFVWLPLQTPGTAMRLGVANSQLLAEMWLQLADGRTFGGVNAWGVMLRRVWWLWPLGYALALPGLNAAARVLYRWIAKNRHCLSGACTIPSHEKATPHQRPPANQHRHAAFLELP